MSNYNYNNSDSASKLLESVLEEMKNIMNEPDLSPSQYNNNDYTRYVNDNNNCLETSPDKRFEFMLEELQSCLKDTAESRSLVQNLSSDKREFVRSLIRTDSESNSNNNNYSVNHKVGLMDEISKLKLDVSYLQRDKQNLLNEVSDLSFRISELEHENRRLKQEVCLMKVEEIDYCIPPTDDHLDLNSVDESFQSKDSPSSNPVHTEKPIAQSTPDKSKVLTASNIPQIPPHANQPRELPAEFLDKIKMNGNNEYTGKACSWSELRTNQVIQNDISTMTPPSLRKNSVNSTDRSRSFGKGDSKSNGYDLRKKMKTMINKRRSQPAYSNSVDTSHSNGQNHFDSSSETAPIRSHNNIPDAKQQQGHFVRNNPLRMTAGPRLITSTGLNQPQQNMMITSDYHHRKQQPSEIAVQRVLSHSNPNLQMITLLPSNSDLRLWTRDHVCHLLHQMGLGVYANNCRRWLTDGQMLLDSSKKEIEKELNINNKLHLKKLLIHLRQLTTTHVTAAAYFSLPRPDLRITMNFNIRLWLDDIGLLHYTNAFTANCVDGYVLDQLTLEDLQYMKISNELHVISIKRGIQLLREIDYDLSKLIRRPTESTFIQTATTYNNDDDNDNLDPDEAVQSTLVCNVTPGEICRWTQHQVMEWLRKIELPEYASNIRGSGIHGALLILEDRFTWASLASVLNIPQSKSLLRRHLQSKFHELIGPEYVSRKKLPVGDKTELHAPLTITSKMKFPRRKTQFFSALKRKPTHEVSEEILVPYHLRIKELDLMLNFDDSVTSNHSDNVDESLNQVFVPNTDL